MRAAVFGQPHHGYGYRQLMALPTSAVRAMARLLRKRILSWRCLATSQEVRSASKKLDEG
jgi:hypothetical protein